MIDKNKTYRTRSGLEVRIYETEGIGDYPVYGTVKSGKTAWQRATWSREGIHCVSDSDSEFDLFECNDKGVEMIDKNKTYRTEDGKEVRIYATDGTGMYPVHGAVKGSNGDWTVESWTKNGRYNPNQSYCDEDTDDIYDLVEHNPLSELKVDDRIFVRNKDNAEWCCEHFARVSENGKVLTFDDGKTSWSSDSDELVEWNQWKLPE